MTKRESIVYNRIRYEEYLYNDIRKESLPEEAQRRTPLVFGMLYRGEKFMALAEKIAIGFLEEDNPIKSYYRFKPLILDNADGYAPLENVEQLYPEDGFLRIVPDKNESSR